MNSIPSDGNGGSGVIDPLSTNDRALQRFQRIVHTIEQGSVDDLEAMLNRGEASVNDRTFNHLTPLHFAVKSNRIEMVDALLQRGADPNSPGDRGDTPLHLAARTGNVEAIRAMLNHGARVRQRSDNGDTSLHLAAKAGHADAVKVLIDADEYVVDRNSQGLDAAALAIRHGHAECLKHVLQAEDKLMEDEVGWSANRTLNTAGKNRLHVAIESAPVDVVQVLLDAGAKMDALTKSGLSALHIATLHNRSDVLRALVAAGAPLDAKDNTGNTALHHAVSNGRAGMVELLKSLGASETIENHNAVSPFDLEQQKKQGAERDPVYLGHKRERPQTMPLSEERGVRASLRVERSIPLLDGTEYSPTWKHEASISLRPGSWGSGLTHGSIVDVEDAKGVKARYQVTQLGGILVLRNKPQGG